MIKLRIWVVNIGIIFVCLFVGIVMVEVVVRIVDLKGLKKMFESIYVEFYFIFYIIFYFVRGWEYRVNVFGWWMSEGKVYLEFNSYGIRGLEIIKVKLENILWIVVFGDFFILVV